MLTAILLACDASGPPLRREAVTRSLSSLVEACVQGLIADAVIVGPGGRGLDGIADDAGCSLIETELPAEGLRAALLRARNERVFLLRAGYAIERGFIDELSDAFAYAEPQATLVLRAAPHSLLTRLAPQLSSAVGLVATKPQLGAIDSADIRTLSRKLKGADLSTRARKVV